MSFTTICIVSSECSNNFLDKYPHPYGNREGLKFDCGTSLLEFPILTSGEAYTESSDIRTIPDRVIFEKKGKTTKLCGVMRHGNDDDFEICPAA